MKVSESHINTSVDSVSENMDRMLIDLGIEQQELSNYLLSDTFSSLSIVEKNLLLFIILVLYNACDADQKAALTFNDFLDHEEKNWSWFEENQKSSWEDKMNTNFKNYTEEDMLAFVEDILVDDEEDDETLSIIGREIIFVTAKSFIDCI